MEKIENEKYCQMLERLFVVFRHSKNIPWVSFLKFWHFVRLLFKKVYNQERVMIAHASTIFSPHSWGALKIQM